MINYPFLDSPTGNAWQDETANRVEKIRAYYDNRELYDQIIKEHPEQRLANDLEKPLTKNRRTIKSKNAKQPDLFS